MPGPKTGLWAQAKKPVQPATAAMAISGTRRPDDCEEGVSSQAPSTGPSRCSLSTQFSSRVSGSPPLPATSPGASAPLPGPIARMLVPPLMKRKLHDSLHDQQSLNHPRVTASAMAYEFGTFDATLAAAAGEDPALHAELRAAFHESLDHHLDLLKRARCDGNR